MMSCRGGAESHQNNVREKSFRIRHDDLKLFSRFLSRQETSNHSSFRVYYGDVSVPFVWESQPGTPKHRFADDGAALRPPLTPPPSYYSNSKITAAGAPARKKKALPGSILLRALLTKVSLRRTKSAAAAAAPSPSPSFSLSSSPSSLSSFSATSTPSSFRGRRARRFSGSSFDKGGIDEDIAKAEPSAACCGIIDMERSILVKKVLFSIVGRRQNLN